MGRPEKRRRENQEEQHERERRIFPMRSGVEKKGRVKNI